MPPTTAPPQPSQLSKALSKAQRVTAAQIIYEAPAAASSPREPSTDLPRAVPLSAALSAEGDSAEHVPLGIPALDRVLGGGLVPGSVILIGGEPGAGKSTLLLQATSKLELGPALYASAEESTAQIAARAARLGLAAADIVLLAGDDVDHAIDMARESRAMMLVVDSIQTMRTAELDAPAGTVAQVGECARRLARFAKDQGMPVVIVGQVTKDGQIAGPKTLEHLVDVVLYLECGQGDRRLLSAFKNRFGSAAELGGLTMTEHGLESIADADADTLSERAAGVAGSAVFPLAVGDRVRLIEVQALVGPPRGDDAGKPALAVSGLDPKRVNVIIAILARHAGIDVTGRDVFVSATSGAKVTDPAADLAIALALASSYRDLPIEPTIACWGELGLAGEIRGVAHTEGRIRACSRAGMLPLARDAEHGAKTLADAIATAIGEVA